MWSPSTWRRVASKPPPIRLTGLKSYRTVRTRGVSPRRRETPGRSFYGKVIIMSERGWPYLSVEKNRHGNTRYYVRRFGRRIQIKVAFGTTEFHDLYNAALKALEQSTPTVNKSTRAAFGTFGWLLLQYYDSADFKLLPLDSRRTRRGILEHCANEGYASRDDKRKMRDFPVASLTAAHIKMLRDRKAGKPGAANHRLKYLSSLFSWAVEEQHVRANVVRDVKRVKYESEGFTPWTADDIKKFCAQWPIGSRERLAFEILYHVGCGRAELVQLGPTNVRDGVITYRRQKTRHAKFEEIFVPMPDELAAVIAATPIPKGETFVQTHRGKPFTAPSFGGWFRNKCDAAGLKGRNSHGIRKHVAAEIAELGASDRQLMATFGWSDATQASIYVRNANRKRLARDAMALRKDFRPSEVKDAI
jgi:integrase